MTFENVKKIHQNISCFIKETPLQRFKELEQFCKIQAPIFLKCENFQITQSFKVRGAANALLKLSIEERNKGVVSRSSGNFGQALACLTEKMGIKCTLVLPENVPPIKLEKTRQYKPEIILHGTTHDAMNEKVEELSSTYGYVKLTTYDHNDIIWGQGTCGYEIIEKNPHIKNLFIPLGGGGLSAGASAVFKVKHPDGKVFVVEPDGAKDYFLSIEKGEKIHLDHIDTIADGLRAHSVGHLNWPILQKNVDQALVVTDQEIIEAMKFIYDHLGHKIEPSGAVCVAALMRYGSNLDLKEPIALILTGGNVADSYFFELFERYLTK